MQKLRIFVRSSIRQEKAVRKPIAEFKANSKLTGLHSECIQFYVLRSIKAPISLALIAFSAYSKGGDWPNWRGPSHDGFSPRLPGVWKKPGGGKNKWVWAFLRYPSSIILSTLKGMMEEKGRQRNRLLSQCKNRRGGLVG